jgi:hypothetical protein
MIFGESRFNIVYGSTSYTPAGWCSLVPDIQDLNLQRRSKITSQENIRDLWTYYNANAKVKNLTVSEIAFFRTISGKEVTLTPCIDKPLISYAVSVTRAEIKYEDGKPWKPYVDLRFDGVYDVEILCSADLFFTITSPIAATYLNGNNMNITWTSSNIPAAEPVKIELYKAGVYVSTMTNYTLNNGSYIWKIAAVLIGSDYQVKITVLRDTDIYVLSSMIGITYDGFYLFDGTDDYITTPLKEISTTGDWTMMFDFDTNGNALFSSDYVLASFKDTANFFHFAIDFNGRIDYRERSSNLIFSVYSGNGFISSAAGWQRIIMTRSFAPAASSANFYNNSITPVAGQVINNTLTSPTLTTDKSIEIGRYLTGKIGNRKLRNIVFYNRVLSTAEIASAIAGNIPSNQVALYRCNDADAGTPWTDNMLDSSGNAKHATPININPATFFNRTPQWRTDENNEIIPDENNEPITIL